jgi:arginase
MANKIVSLVGAAQGWGAGRPETQNGPRTLQEQGLAQSLQVIDPLITWHGIVEPDIPSTPHEHLHLPERIQLIARFSEKLAKEVKACKKLAFPVILGGDHSVAIGTWSGVITALEAQSEFGLIWIDAHMDAHTQDTTPSGNIHGMPLAALLGHGASELIDICEKGAKLHPSHVVLIGVRSFEPDEAELLDKLNVKVFYMTDVKKRGFESIFHEALETVSQGTKAFGVSIDLDAFDPTFAPGTGTQESGGIDPIDVIPCLSQIKDNPAFKALEIVEFDPTRDIDNKSAKLIQDLIQSII